MHIVLKHSRLVDSREIAAARRSATTTTIWTGFRNSIDQCTHPRVKTFSSEVLPQAPSPLYLVSMFCPSCIMEFANIAPAGGRRKGDSQQDKLALDSLGAPETTRHFA